MNPFLNFIIFINDLEEVANSTRKLMDRSKLGGVANTSDLDK